MSASVPVVSARKRTFAALQVRNFRLYILGQTISQAGTWMQQIGQGWLVLRLTGSGTALGVVIACQALPVLFFAPAGGLLVDRVDKQKLLIITQLLSGVLALALWALTATETVEVWMVYGLALMLGFVLVFDNPVRQSMPIELVGPELLTNAVSLNNINFNVSRVFGPALAGVTINQLGISPCFLLNGVTYATVVIALLMLHKDELHIQPRQARARRQVREGMRYVWRTPQLRVPVILMFVVGMLTYETGVTLPLLAKDTFHGGAGTYSLFTAAMGVGAVIVGLGYAARMNVTRGLLLRVTVVLGVFMFASAAAPTQGIELVALVALGGASVTFLVAANATLQLATPPEMRGRVLALWSMAFMGSTPIGGPMVGWIGEHVGPRWSIFVGGAGPIVAAAVAWPMLARLHGGLGIGSSPETAVAAAAAAAADRADH
ncbi:MAG: MFS transporter [Acidimicrobiales bacterium]